MRRRGAWVVVLVVACRTETSTQVQPVASASASASASVVETAPSASATVTGLASALHHSIEPPGLGGSSGPTPVVAVSVSGGSAADERVVTAMNGRFRACAAQALARDPSQRGRLSIAVDIAADGTVSNADVTTNTGLGPPCADCIVRGIQHARFPPAATRKLTVSIDQTSAVVSRR
jgi:hypothetical protein